MKLTYHTPRAAAILTGAAINGGMAYWLIETQNLDFAHATKTGVIMAGATIGAILANKLTTKGLALLVVGLIAAEAFNVASAYDQMRNERAERLAAISTQNSKASVDYSEAKQTAADAKARLAKAETALTTAEAKRAEDAPQKACRKECSAMHADAVTAARNEVSAARLAVDQLPKLGPPPVPIALPESQFDWLIALLGSLGANAIAIALLSGSKPANQPQAQRHALPQIKVASEAEHNEHHRKRNAARRTASPESPVQAVRKPESENLSGNPTEASKGGRPSNPDIIAFVDGFRTANNRTPTGTEILKRFPACPRSTAFDIAARYRQPVLALVA